MSYVSPSVVTEEILEAIHLCQSLAKPVVCGMFQLTSRAGVVVAEALDDVVLDKRACCPAVDGDIAVDVGGVPCAAVLDGAITASCPSLAGNKVVAIRPVHAVLARRLVVVRHATGGAGVVEGVEEAVVRARAGGG